MLFHKTKVSERETYKYSYSDGSTFTINPGENGVTEIDIKQLHSFDDATVYNNIKNTKPPVEAWQKSLIEAWKAEHPGEEPPKNWAISLEQAAGEDDADGFVDKSSILKEIYDRTDEPESPAIERLHEIIENLSPLQQNTYQKVVIEGIPMVKVAKAEGVSETAIRHRMDKIKAHIAKDVGLKKYF